MTEKLLSTEEVAEWLNLDVRTVAHLASGDGKDIKPQIPAAKVGRSWRFSRTDVEAYLEQNRNIPGGKASS